MKKACCLLILILSGSLTLGLAALRAEEEPAGEKRWTILLEGNPAGTQTRQTTETGQLLYTFEYSDRGRGPRLETRLTLNKDGIPTRIETTGHDYLKAPVAESFALTGGIAQWQNSAEQDHRKQSRPAFYWSKDAAHPQLALLARALLAAPEKRLALLPDGEAHLQVLGKHVLEMDGELRVLTQVAVSGLSFTPDTVWLDENNDFFGIRYSWFTVVPEGAEASAAMLRREDERFRARRFADLAGKLAHKPGRGVAFTGVALFDAESQQVIPDTTVVVLGDRIEAVGPDGSVPIPIGVEILDARGKTLLPGLWDMHAHLDDIDGVLNIAAGVTTVRDLANVPDDLLPLKKQWEAGSAIGPRVVLAGGFVDGTGPYAFPTKMVATEEELLTAIDAYADLGYEQIKIYSSLKPDLVPVAVARAHQRGLKISGHIPNGMTAEQAVNLGLDEIQHINMLFLNFWDEEGIDTRTPARFTAVAERAATLDLDSERVNQFVALLKEKNIVVDPTVTVFETMFTAPPGTIGPNFSSIPFTLPLQARRGAWGGGLPPPEGMEETYKESFAAMLRLVKKLYDAGVPFVAGTDDLPGFTLHRELELYVEAGIPAPAVLALATLGAARLAGRDDQVGAIKPGLLADLVLVDGNPADNISDIRNVELTVRNGLLYRSRELYQALGITPQE